MTPQERKVMELALQALESMQNAIYNISGEHIEVLNYAVKKANVAEQTITTIKEALAKPDQEPVAWMNDMGTHIDLNVSGRGIPLYTTPPQRKPLTDEEMKKIWYAMQNIMGWYSFEEVARAIEAAHNIKE